jgi:hypothetical protein
MSFRAGFGWATLYVLDNMRDDISRNVESTSRRSSNSDIFAESADVPSSL